MGNRLFYGLVGVCLAGGIVACFTNCGGDDQRVIILPPADSCAIDDGTKPGDCGAASEEEEYEFGSDGYPSDDGDSMSTSDTGDGSGAGGGGTPGSVSPDAGKTCLKQKCKKGTKTKPPVCRCVKWST